VKVQETMQPGTAVDQITEMIALASDGPGFVFAGMNAWEMGPGCTAVRPDHFIGLVEGAPDADLLAPRLLDPTPG
jgi:hypothetical protein